MCGQQQLVEFVGTGSMSASIVRERPSPGSATYRLVVVHEDQSRGSLCLTPDDLLDLPRFAQLAAQTLLQDGWLSEPFADDLRSLLAAIELVESRPQPYFVCEACDAKWFGKRSRMPCPRCFRLVTSRERLLIPWLRS